MYPIWQGVLTLANTLEGGGGVSGSVIGRCIMYSPCVLIEQKAMPIYVSLIWRVMFLNHKKCVGGYSSL